MFAVIKTGGKQYRVTADDLIEVEKLAGEAGSMIEFPDVLMVGADGAPSIGAPFVDGALVTGEIVEQGRGPKVYSFKKRRRQNSKRIRGHRQLLTTVRISEILTGGAKPKKTAAKKPAAKAEPAAKPKAEKAAPAKAAPAKAKADEIVDDISLIGGVGPALKKKLEGAGVTSLKQLADMKAADMAKLDEELKLGGRTEREEWGEQARELLAGKPPRAKVDKKAADKG